MSLFERIAAKRRRDELDAPVKLICVRCRREYTPEPETVAVEEHCWWCSARVSQSEIPIVTE